VILEKPNDLRLLKMLGPADRLAVVHAVADSRIRARAEQQAHHFRVAPRRRQMQRRDVGSATGPATVDWCAAIQQPFHRRDVITLHRGEEPTRVPELSCDAPRRQRAFPRLTPEHRLKPIFESTSAALVVCGHTHMQFDRTIGEVRVVNAGSVGMPFGDPGAYWLLLGPVVEFRHTRYDFAAATERIRATAYPGVSEFEVMRPPREDKMVQLFESAALR
jgi:Calcineurin-like phosphoesterase superfamily domain